MMKMILSKILLQYIKCMSTVRADKESGSEWTGDHVPHPSKTVLEEKEEEENITTVNRSPKEGGR